MDLSFVPRAARGDLDYHKKKVRLDFRASRCSDMILKIKIKKWDLLSRFARLGDDFAYHNKIIGLDFRASRGLGDFKKQNKKCCLMRSSKLNKKSWTWLSKNEFIQRLIICFGVNRPSLPLGVETSSDLKNDLFFGFWG